MATENEVRARLLTDFEFYSRHCVKIRTKKGTIVPLVLNRVQKRFLKAIVKQQQTTGKVRFVVLKARQQGLSTVITAWQYWWLSQRKAQKGLVMAHETDSTITLFDMYKRVHDNCPARLRPHAKYSSRGEMQFDILDTGLRVATAGGRGVARGETLTTAHLSEVAFWPVAFANNNFNGLVQAIPEEPGTACFLESTANGMTGKFREMWVGADPNAPTHNGYEQFFSPWFESDEYREPAPADFVRTPEEEKMMVQFAPLLNSNDQLFWRRRKIALNGAALFKQEYPATPDEAFLSTGRPVFNPDYLNERISNPVTPIKRMAVEDVPGSPIGVLKEHPLGELFVYHDLDPSQNYVIGADVGMGLRASASVRKDSDPSVAQVLDGDLRQVAVWRGIVHPDYFAKVLMTLGYHYNSALVAPERNNHGLVTCVKLRDLEYPYIYTEVPEGTLEAQRDSISLGFFTSERTKPLIIDQLRAYDRDRDIEINDLQTLREMLTFIVTESGKMQAEEGEHDDCVLSMAIAAYVHDGKWKPVEVSQEHYTNAI
ncbi:hypothetical protein HU230_0012435 [Bradyrhizobium quebecense]|uniref:Terminase n=1 Tax=Bradyrhizobium quebecense TaxID=2748629 RepID=A0A973WQ72_9BRAD|nr:hypothetical protein [Bradyrhizobium quebecense]UGA46796.1 hypothetical protein HU230_0012435 [Bradyrhizobium quebecense]